MNSKNAPAGAMTRNHAPAAQRKTQAAQHRQNRHLLQPWRVVIGPRHLHGRRQCKKRNSIPAWPKRDFLEPIAPLPQQNKREKRHQHTVRVLSVGSPNMGQPSQRGPVSPQAGHAEQPCNPCCSTYIASPLIHHTAYFLFGKQSVECEQSLDAGTKIKIQRSRCARCSSEQDKPNFR